MGKTYNETWFRHFKILSICRADLKEKFTDQQIESFSDSDMEYLAVKMSDACIDIGCWLLMPIIVEQILKNKVDVSRDIPKSLEPLAREARKFKSVEEWKESIQKESRGKTVLGKDVLSPLSLKGSVVTDYGFKNLLDFYNQATKGGEK